MRIKSFNFTFLNDRMFLCRLLLISSWILGILCGCFFATQTSDKASLMHMLLQSHMSIVGGLAVSFLPLCISAVIISLNKTALLIPLAFVKAFMYSFSSACVICAFGTAGWLVRLLFLFSDSLISLFCFRLWLCCFSGVKRIEWECMSCAICCVCVFTVDCLIIAPFTAMIL